MGRRVTARGRRTLGRKASQTTIPTWLFRAMLIMLIINALTQGVGFFQ